MAEAAEATWVQPGEAGVATPGEFSKQPLSTSFFFFENFLLLKPAAPNIHLVSHTDQLSNQI